MLLLNNSLTETNIRIISISSLKNWDSHGSPPVPGIPNRMMKSKRILKKFKIKTILKIPGHIGLDKVDIWLQDEARFGQQNTTTKLWALKGTRPGAIKQQQFEYAYLFGSVCPSRGIGEAIVVPWVNKDAMSLHLTLISNATEKGRHAVVLMDGAGEVFQRHLHHDPYIFHKFYLQSAAIAEQ